MARGRRGGRRYFGRQKRRGGKSKHGLIFGMGLFDLAQLADNVTLVGGVDAANQATSGDWAGAGNTLATTAGNNFPALLVHNIMWMVVKKVGRKYMGKMGRYF